MLTILYCLGFVVHLYFVWKIVSPLQITIADKFYLYACAIIAGWYLWLNF